MRPLSEIFMPWRSPGRTAKGRRASGQKRRQAVLVWRRRVLASTLAAAAMAATAGGSYWVWRDGFVHRLATDAVAQVRGQLLSAGLSVDEVLVTGRRQIAKQEVLAALGIDRGGLILAFDPARARQRLLALEWIRDVRVERRLPDTVVVHLQEREPLALWQHRGRHLLIDRDGQPITGRDLGRFAHLPIVIGRDAPQHAAGFLDILRTEPLLLSEVEASVRVGGRRWNLHLRNGVSVNLPEKDTGAAWAKLAELARDHRIFERDVSVIDLRFPGRLVVRVRKQDGIAKSQSGKDT